jgi:hypothetical protein
MTLKAGTIKAGDVAALTVMLSPARLASFTDLTGSAQTAIELHQETLQLGAFLMNVTATIEIALRNSVCENLKQHFDVPNWLLQPPIPFQWRKSEQSKLTMALHNARRAKYAKLTQIEKAALDAPAYPKGIPSQTLHLRREQDRRKQIAVSDGEIIAELTFYFWKRLYGPEYEQTLWRTSLKRTFPYKKLSRSVVSACLEKIYQARNRLAHHEPVLHQRFADTMQAIIFVTHHLEAAPPGSATSLANLLADNIADVTARAEALHARLDAFRVGA